MLDSDMSAEMILADILNKEHSLTGLTTNWIYGSELRVFEMQWFYRIGLALFPHNWHMARTISMALAILLLAYAAWLVFYSIEMQEIGIWAAAFTIFPGGGWYFWQTIYGAYYLPYIYFSLFSFSLIMFATKKKGKRLCLTSTLGVVLLGFASGLNGIRQLMLFYVPMDLAAGGVLVQRLICTDKGESDNESNGLFAFVISLAATASSFAGYLINSHLLAKKYSFLSFDDIEIAGGEFLSQIRDYIWSFGFVEGKPLMSPVGIASMFGVIFGIFVVTAGIVMLMKISDLTYGQRLLVLFSTIGVLTSAFVFSYTEWGGIQYFMPLVPFGYYLVLLWIYSGSFVFKQTRFFLANAAIIILLITSLGTVYNESREPIHQYRAHPTMNNLVTWLRGGYTQGAGLFWVSNLVTELSDGDIEMWTQDPHFRDDWFHWLQPMEHMGNKINGKFFYLVDNALLEGEFGDEYTGLRDKFLNDNPGLTEIYRDEEYTVYAIIDEKAAP